MITEFKRIKHHQQRGDVSKQSKIKMREKRTPFTIWYSTTYGHLISNNCAKSFRKFLQDKSKKRQRQRDKETISNDLNEN